jgi:aconitate decarboxylase
MTSKTIPSNQPMDLEGATGKLCNWAHSLTLSSIPTNVKTRAQYLLLDGIACALVGAHLPWSEKAANAIFEMEPAGDSEVVGWNRRISPLSAALINSTFIQGFELDDWHSEAPLHSNSIILPALFAAAEHLNKLPSAETKIDGKAFLLAYLVGLEIGPRVGNGLYGADMLTRGWHSGAVFGPAVSSISACKMMGLDAGLMEDALGIACTQACGLMSAQFESEVKRMQHGFAARSGLLAALLARGGYVGIKKVLERPYGGYLAMFGQGSGKEPAYLVEEVTKGLGEKWQTWGVRVKPYAAMAGTHPTVDCIRKLQAEHPEQIKDLGAIASIKLEMGEAAFHHGGWKAVRPLTSTGAQMSNAYVAATQLVDGQVLPAQFRHDKLESDEVWSLVDKTSCEYNKHFDGRYNQRATITFKDKPTVTAMVNAAKGVDPALTNEEIVEKWRLIIKGVIDDERRARIEKLCLNFEAMEDVTELLDLLAGTTENPIA